MRDKDLCGQILGTKAPWFVEDVNLDILANKVEYLSRCEPLFTSILAG